jgi:hypothetical protein
MANMLFGPAQTTPAISNPATGIMGRLAQASKLMTMLRGMRNPQAGISELLNQNPQINSLIQNGQDPKAAFYAMAQAKGVDPESILGPLRTMMK